MIGHYARHLMHRKCRPCWERGYAAGFYKAAVEAERRERLMAQLLREGVNPWDLEQSLRQRIAEQEAAA